MAGRKNISTRPSKRKSRTKRNNAPQKVKKRVGFKFSIPYKYLLIFVVLLGFLLRVINLGELSLWVDEYVHVNWVKSILSGNGLGASQLNGISFTLSILPFCALFEVSEFWTRLPSCLYGTASIGLLYFLGKKLFNRNVGLLSAFLGAVSLYLVFWGRLARNYAIFEFSFLLLLLVFLLAFESESTEEGNFWKKNGLNKKYLVAFPFVFVFSLISHLSTYFFLFIFITYCLLNTIPELLRRKAAGKIGWINKYSIFTYLTLAGGAFIAIFPTFSYESILSILELFLGDNTARTFPKWSNVTKAWAEKRYDVFNMFYDVLKYDFNYLHYLGLLGLITSFFWKKKSAFFLVSVVIVPFLLQSFIFRDPALPRYIIYIYPIFLIGIAAFLHFLVDFITQHIPKNLSRWSWILKVIPFLVILPFIRYTELSNLLKVKKKYGFVVDKKLSHWSFTNWKEPANYVKVNKKPGDIILSTVPSATNHYTGEKDNILFRQTYLDRKTLKYLHFDESYTSNRSAQTLNGLVKTINENPKGWLIADYYFDNVYTDPKAREIVFQNMDLHFDASSEGYVRVFSWDHSRPRVSNQDMVEIVGKSDTKMASQELKFNYAKGTQSSKNLLVQTRAQAVSHQEAFFVINKKYKYYLPANKTTGIEILPVSITRDKLQEGQNTIQYGYNPKAQSDYRKGFAVHQVRFANQ